MKILLIDPISAILDFAMRLDATGHTVRVFMGQTEHGMRSKVGNGLIDRVEDWRPSMKWADLIVLSDNTKYMRELDTFRLQGYPIFGPTAETAQWELDRDKGQKILQRAGIDTIPSVEFNNYDDAIAHVTREKKRFVAKPNGDADKALSYVSKSPKDILFMLNRWKKNGRPKDPFILQEFHGGIEMAVGGWFGPAGFSTYFLENFEHKKLMNGDLGPNTGEQGTVLKYTNDSKLADMMLAPLVGELHRQQYTGYIDVAVIIDPKGNVWPLEFTTRPGWPLFQIQQVLHPDLADWMHDLVNGFDSFRPSEKIATGVVLTMPPFPIKQSTANDNGYPLWGVNKTNRYFVHPSEMMAGFGPDDTGRMSEMLVTVGNYVATITGIGDTVSESRDAAYEHLKELELPNSSQYRTDIGDRVIEQLSELKKLGFATSWHK